MTEQSRPNLGGYVGEGHDAPALFGPLSLKPNKGNRISSRAARMVASTEWNAGRDRITFTVYENIDGDLLAVRQFEPLSGGEGDTYAETFRRDDHSSTIALQSAVMRFFDWELRARSMLRKQAGWQFAEEF